MKDSTKDVLTELVNWLNDQIKNSDPDKCSWCGSDKVKPKDFKDALSIKEFGISGFCQKCQDKTFG